MSELRIKVNRVYNNSSIVEVTRKSGKGKLRVILPEFFVLENSNYSQIEVKDIFIQLAREQRELLEQAKKKDIYKDIEI